MEDVAVPISGSGGGGKLLFHGKIWIFGWKSLFFLCEKNRGRNIVLFLCVCFLFGSRENFGARWETDKEMSEKKERNFCRLGRRE